MREEDQIDMMHDSHAMWQEIDRLRADLAQRTVERDEARRMACEYEARYEEERCYPLDPPDEKNIQLDTKRIAAERGWDCFDAKEGR